MKRYEVLAYSAVAVGVAVGLFGVVVTRSVTLLLVSVVVLGVSGVFVMFGDWILPSLLGVAGRHPVYETLEIEEDAVLMREGDTWRAVGYFIMEVLHSPLEESEKEQLSYFIMLTSLFSHLPARCVISQYVSPVNVEEVRKKIRRDLNMASADLAGASQERDTPKQRQLKQEIKEYEHQLETLDSDRPIDVSFYAKVSASAATKEGAKKEMRGLRQGLESNVRGVMRVNTRVARGKELKQVVALDMVVPRRETV